MHTTQKKYTKIITFTIGLTLLLIGFFVDHTKEIPLVERVLAPKSYFLRDALIRLDNKELLTRDHPAFNYILEICSPSGFDLNVVEALGKGTTTFDMTKAQQKNWFNIHLHSGDQESREPICKSDKLEESIENGKGFLILGLIISIAGYLIK